MRDIPCVIPEKKACDKIQKLKHKTIKLLFYTYKNELAWYGNKNMQPNIWYSPLKSGV